MHSKLLALLSLSTLGLAQTDYSDLLDDLDLGADYSSAMDDLNNVLSMTDYDDIMSYYSENIGDYSDYLTDLPTDLGDYTDYLTDLPTDIGDYSDYFTDIPTDYSSYLTDLPTGTDSVSSPTSTGDSSSESGNGFDDIANLPNSVIEAIQSAVPSSEIRELLNPTSRESILNDIANGDAPSWFDDLPEDVQQYILTNLAHASGTTLPTSIPTTSSGGGNGPSSGDDVPDVGASLSSSVMVSVAAAAGILGLTLVL